MNPKSNAQHDAPAALNCPKCGAPAVLPFELGVVTLTCQYCDETFTIPQSIRDAQERRLKSLRGANGGNSVTANVVGLVVGLTILGVLISGIAAFIGSQKSKTAVTQPPRDEPVVVVPPTTVATPSTTPDESATSGESRVRELMASYASAGCTVLLPATRIVGGRDIDAKLVTNGPCVRLLAASGTGDKLELTMKTPKGRPVTTPEPTSELDFIYCAKQAGLHPAAIRSSAENPFTVASIECPRR